MANMSVEDVATAIRATLESGSPGHKVTGISIDSRTLKPGDLFFAIRGKTDGHRFVSAALSNGACGAVVDSSFMPKEGLLRDRILLRVENTHRALKDLGAEVRQRWRGSLVGITGSIGKTTTKEFAAHVLQTEYSVYRSPGNYNNLFGLPLSLYGLKDDDHIGVFEMGMSARGEIAEMCRIARPDVGVITNIAHVHMEFFKSIEEIALAKEELAQALGHSGTLIYNVDDPLLQRIAGRFLGQKISFGVSESAVVRAEEIETVGLEETRFRVSCLGVARKASIPLAGMHYVMNVLPAIALGHHYRIPLEQSVESLKDLRPAPMRGQILRFKEGFSVIDDTYNSSPRALVQAIENLRQLPSGKRRILVAGEMLELGANSRSLHYQCGSIAAGSGINVVVAVQGDAQELARGAIAAGIPDFQVHFFVDSERAAQFVVETAHEGDALLIKGSRGVHMERIVRALQTRFAEETS
jgi:UDP-N-acetylmuramoyl-tripeptide--D-alanyl-D-alanine ligase